MSEPAAKQDDQAAPQKRSVWPIGLITGVAAGIALGFARGDVAMSASTAVALGICFAFLAPLVRDLLTRQKSDDAAEFSARASSQEKDSQ